MNKKPDEFFEPRYSFLAGRKKSEEKFPVWHTIDTLSMT